jgi:TP901 family phage tail tape measure protein
MAGNFEASMTRLVSIAGVGANEINGVKERILELSRESGVGPQMLADAMTKVSSTTNDTAKALDILNIAALGTKAGFGDTVEVAGALTAVVNSYADSNLTAAAAGDIMAVAIKEGGAEAKELAPTLANVVPQAAQLGISFEEVAANLATLTKLGVPTAEAVTQLSAVMTAMSKRTKEGEEALASINMTYESLREKVGKQGLQATLAELNQAFAGNIDGLTGVFGRIEAVRNIMGTAGVQGEVYAQVLDKIKHASDGSQGALKDMADAMDGKAVQTWAEFTALMQTLAIRIGDELAPAFQDMIREALPLVDWAIDAVKWFGELPDPVRNTVIALGGLGAIAAPALIALGASLSGLTAIITVLGGAVTVTDGLLFTMGNTVPVLTARIWLMDAAAESAWIALAGPVGIAAGILAVAVAWGNFQGDWTRSFDVLVPPLGIFRAELDQTRAAMKTTGEAAVAASKGDWQAAIDIISNFGLDTVPQIRDSLGNIPLGLRKAAGDLPQALKPVETGLYAIGGAGQVMGDGLNSAATRGEAFQKHLKDINTEVANFTDEEKKNIQAGKDHNIQIKDMATNLDLSEEAIKLYIDRLDESKKATEKHTAETDKMNQAVRAINNEIGVHQMDAMAKGAEAARNWAAAMVDAKMKAENAAFAAKATFEAMSNSGSPVKGFGFSSMTLGQFLPPWMLKDEPVNLPGMDLGKGIKDSLTKTMSEVPDILIKAFTGGGGISGALSALGTMAGSGLGEQLGKKLGESISSIASFAGPMGSAIGALAGPMIEMFTKMLDHTAKDVKRLAAGYGAEISDEIAGAIKDSMKSLNLGEQAATIFNADKLFPKVDATNFADALKIVHDAYSMIETNQLTVAQGNKVVDDMWKKIGDTGTDSTGRISAGMKELIALNERFGFQSKEINKFLADQASVAVSGFNAVADGMTISWRNMGKEADDASVKTVAAKDALDKALADPKASQDQIANLTSVYDAAQAKSTELHDRLTAHATDAKQELEDMGIQAVAVFSAAIKSGMSFNDAIKAAGPGLTDLSKSFDALGISTENVALKALMIQSNILDKNPELMAAVGGLESQMIALDNVGMMNADTFAAMERTGYAMYTKLQGAAAAAGGASEDALAPMQGYLHKAEEQAKLLGIPLDANTQMLIDQSKQLGLWKDAGKTANDKLLDGVDKLNASMQGVADKIESVIGNLINMPSVRNTEVNVHYNYSWSGDTGPGPQQVHPQAEGGFGTTTKPTLFMTSEDSKPEQFAFSGQGKKFDTAPSDSSGGGSLGSDEAVGFLESMDRTLRDLPRAMNIAMKDALVH